MLDVQEAQNIVLQHTPPGRAVTLPLESAPDHYLAVDVIADMDVPPFDRAAMDGYALRAEDVQATPAFLEVIGESPAGLVPTFTIGHGQAARIMTGAVVPAGADAVQMVEKTEAGEAERRVRVLMPVGVGDNITRRGVEVRRGQKVLTAGRYLGAGEIAVLAMFGHVSVLVWQKPTVAVLATGDELVEPCENPKPGQIRNSNSYALAAQLRTVGLQATRLTVAKDTKADLRMRIVEGLAYDLLLLTGGVSMGKYDLVEEILAELGIAVFFDHVAIKPGKPVVFGRKGDGLIFGLPGNPVSSYVTFECLVRPALLKWMGGPTDALLMVTGELENRIKQKPGRMAFLPAWSVWDHGRWSVKVLPSKGSADIVAFSLANSLFVFPKDRTVYEPGDPVSVLLLDDFFRRRRATGL